MAIGSALALALTGAVIACSGQQSNGDCGPPTFHNIQYTWCSTAFECNDDAGAGPFVGLGNSVIECSNNPDLPFITKMYDELGGPYAADRLIGEHPAEFEDCLTYLARVSCSEAAALEQLFEGGGYCDARILKGESPALPRLEMCD
jgi:hypothetical protein